MKARQHQQLSDDNDDDDVLVELDGTAVPGANCVLEW